MTPNSSAGAQRSTVFPVLETARYPTKSLVTREAAKDTTIWLRSDRLRAVRGTKISSFDPPLTAVLTRAHGPTIPAVPSPTNRACLLATQEAA